MVRSRSPRCSVVIYRRFRVWIMATAALRGDVHRRPGLRVHRVHPQGPQRRHQPVRFELLHPHRHPRHPRASSGSCGWCSLLWNSRCRAAWLAGSELGAGGDRRAVLALRRRRLDRDLHRHLPAARPEMRRSASDHGATAGGIDRGAGHRGRPAAGATWRVPHGACAAAPAAGRGPGAPRRLRQYVVVAVVLAVITAGGDRRLLTWATPVPDGLIVVLLLSMMVVIKFFLVASWFMHLTHRPAGVQAASSSSGCDRLAPDALSTASCCATLHDVLEHQLKA